ncbi:uncharacterized protein (DUF305 family) [Streptomyces sp. CG 926]|uniref:DUF305 domain-containing protein n=1 Tax=Streptomyces sp. CG 926 TaxID=1882405 RepID=UPI000D6DA9BC|nr:DUF305 domain-containing protein [Streptomyces sp. CG 926]PWK65094.1 uncharacterized protein (DUF305 family) [Streptomyces sp. CG 926]
MSGSAHRPRWAAWGLVWLLLCSVAGAVVFAFPSGGAATTGPAPATAADTGFSRDMAAHHQQAVEMSFLVRENTTDEEVRTLAFDVINTQANQRGMMLGWLDMWQSPKLAPEGAMAWMDGHGSGMAVTEMPGMATRAQLEQLKAAKGRDAEVLYLQLMIPHHRGGVVMAEAAVKQGKNDQVKALAEGIVLAQQAEIDLMNGMLTKRGAQPVTLVAEQPAASAPQHH